MVSLWTVLSGPEAQPLDQQATGLLKFDASDHFVLKNAVLGQVPCLAGPYFAVAGASLFATVAVACGLGVEGPLPASDLVPSWQGVQGAQVDKAGAPASWKAGHLPFLVHLNCENQAVGQRNMGLQAMRASVVAAWALDAAWALGAAWAPVECLGIAQVVPSHGLAASQAA